jgi:hypothetical protein
MQLGLACSRRALPPTDPTDGALPSSLPALAARLSQELPAADRATGAALLERRRLSWNAGMDQQARRKWITRRAPPKS